jgi:hypothetical protein
MLVDAYSNVSGGIDAVVWILFGPVLWGIVFWFIWQMVRHRKSKSTPETETDMKSEKRASGGLTSSTAPAEKEWKLPRYSSGYLKNSGWYADPSGKFEKRYFNGMEWTDEVLAPDGPGDHSATNAPSGNTVSQMQVWRLPRNADGSLQSPGYYWDPSGRYKKRYFDGESWTQNVLPRKDSPDVQLTTDSPLIGHSDHTSLSKSAITIQVDSSKSAVFEAHDATPTDAKVTPTNVAQDLQTLADLYERGLLSHPQYEAAKTQILNQEF